MNTSVTDYSEAELKDALLNSYRMKHILRIILLVAFAGSVVGQTMTPEEAAYIDSHGSGSGGDQSGHGIHHKFFQQRYHIQWWQLDRD